MKQIINGHLYDTDLAKAVADSSEWIGPEKSPTGSKCKVTETLYREIALKQGVRISDARKKTSWGGYVWDDDKIDCRTGAFFLVVGIGWYGSDASVVRPLTEDQAKSWFERHHGDEVDKYTAVFGEPTSCVPEYREETEREKEIRKRENEIETLKNELAAANAARQDAEDRLSKISGCLEADEEA